jgi:hypothetical protein
MLVKEHGDGSHVFWVIGKNRSLDLWFASVVCHRSFFRKSYKILYKLRNMGGAIMSRYEEQRSFLKSNFHEFKKIKTDKIKGLPKPPIVKAFNASSEIIDLPKVNEDVVKITNIYECINERRSTRFFC